MTNNAPIPPYGKFGKDRVAAEKELAEAIYGEIGDFLGDPDDKASVRSSKKLCDDLAKNLLKQTLWRFRKDLFKLPKLTSGDPGIGK